MKAKQGKAPVIQRVAGELHDLAFSQSAPWVVVHDARCERIDFSGHKFAPLAVGSASFIECDFSRARFLHSSLGDLGASHPQALYRDCQFDRADMRHMPHIGNARFERCTFRETRIEGWRADRAEFIDCVFSGALHDCRFTGRPWEDEGATGRERNEFHGNDFCQADLSAVQFAYGVDIDAQLLPQGDNYVRLSRPRERIDRVRALISRWPDDRDREYALAGLKMVDSPGDLEQDWLFLDRRLFLGGRIPDVDKQVLEMLEHALD